MSKIKVSRAKHMTKGLPRNATRPYNWKVSRRISDTQVMTIVYEDFRTAIQAAVDLYEYEAVVIRGLRGFHIEEK